MRLKDTEIVLCLYFNLCKIINQRSKRKNVLGISPFLFPGESRKKRVWNDLLFLSCPSIYTPACNTGPTTCSISTKLNVIYPHQFLSSTGYLGFYSVWIILKAPCLGRKLILHYRHNLTLQQILIKLWRFHHTEWLKSPWTPAGTQIHFSWCTFVTSGKTHSHVTH